jgi:hypothetical protein
MALPPGWGMAFEKRNCISFTQGSGRGKHCLEGHTVLEVYLPAQHDLLVSVDGTGLMSLQFERLPNLFVACQPWFHLRGTNHSSHIPVTITMC